MSAAEHADDEPAHQAGWVYFATYGTCLAFLALLMFAKAKFLAAAAIMWFTLASMPAQLYLARRNWTSLGITLVVTAGGYLALLQIF